MPTRLALCTLVALVTLTGCYRVIIQRNKKAMLQLRLGMPKAEALQIMGPPNINEAFKLPNGNSATILYYYTHRKLRDGLCTKDECTPIVFIGDELVGWGEDVLNSRLFQAGWQKESRDPPVQPATQQRLTATGFAVSSNGLIVTANHVIEDATQILVHLPTGPKVQARVLQTTAANDLAVIQVDEPTKDYLRIAPLRSAATGDQVFTLGYPLSDVLGQEVKYTDGSISSLTGVGAEAAFMQTSVPIQPGSSGGPLLNEDGYVVGVITSSAAIVPFIELAGTLPQNVNWAVKADYLRLLIDVPTEPSSADSKHEAISLAKKAVCLIEVYRTR